MIRPFVTILLMIITLPTLTSAIQNTAPQGSSEYGGSINRGTHLTFRRYYFISRLDRTMQLLLKLQATHNVGTLRSIHFDMSLFNDKRIIRSLKRIQETKSLKPLFMVWDDFIAYKSLEDNIFIEDFSKEIFVITRTMLSSLEEHATEADIIWLQQLSYDSSNKTEELLDAIDITTYALQKAIPDTSHYSAKTAHRPPLDLKTEVSSDEIALRFYYIRRLKKAVELINTQKNSSSYRALSYPGRYKSPHICSLLRAMQESDNPNALMDVWHEIKEYKFIDNIGFMKEFISVVFITLRHFYNGTADASFIAATESHLENLDIEDVLHAIDIISDQLSNHTELYTGYTATSPKDWLQHYWWVPPFTIGCIAMRLAYYFYTQQ